MPGPELVSHLHGPLASGNGHDRQRHWLRSGRLRNLGHGGAADREWYDRAPDRRSEHGSSRVPVAQQRDPGGQSGATAVVHRERPGSIRQRRCGIHTNAHSGANADQHVGTKQHPRGRTERYTNGTVDRDANSDANAKPDTLRHDDSDPDANRQPDSDGDCNAYPFRVADRHPDRDTDLHTDANADIAVDRDADAAPVTDADTNQDAHGD